MGGNALKNCKTGRLDKEDFLTLGSEVIKRLTAKFPSSSFHVIEAFKSKETFGDLDILCTDMPSEDYQVILTDLFDSKEIVHNSSVYSFEFNEFQVDLIFTKKEDFESSKVYFAFNDLGNFMGRIAHKLGFKYGNDGLSYQFRNSDDHVFAKYNVTREPNKLFEFLGYDYTKFKQGFNDLEEIFVFASSSEFFNKEIFNLDNRNATSRVRDRKRANYNGFMTWMETKNDLPAFQWYKHGGVSEKGGRKDNGIGLPRAFEMFPEFKTWYDETIVQLERTEYAKIIFNATLVMSITNLEGPALGNFMKHLKERANNDMPMTDFFCDVLKTEEATQKWITHEFSNY